MYIILCCYVLINFIRLNSFYNKQYKKERYFSLKINQDITNHFNGIYIKQVYNQDISINSNNFKYLF